MTRTTSTIAAPQAIVEAFKTSGATTMTVAEVWAIVEKNRKFKGTRVTIATTMHVQAGKPNGVTKKSAPGKFKLRKPADDLLKALNERASKSTGKSSSGSSRRAEGESPIGDVPGVVLKDGAVEVKPDPKPSRKGRGRKAEAVAAD